MDVSAEREARVRVAQPDLDLFEVLAVGKQQRSAGVAKAVKADPGHFDQLACWIQDSVGDLAADQLRADVGGEDWLLGAGVVRLAMRAESGGHSWRQRNVAPAGPLFRRRRLPR